MLWGAVKTGHRLQTWGIGHGRCPRGHCREPETLLHLLWQCPSVSLLWEWVENVGSKVFGPTFNLTLGMVLFAEGLVPKNPHTLFIWFVICR